jgi:hypothetical protein
MIRRHGSPALLLLLAGCAGYGGKGLAPGFADEAEVVRVMGQPAMQWTDPDGARQLAYPRGPTGVHTFMVRLGPDGRLLRIENALEPTRFAQLRPNMGQAEVLRLLGPGVADWTAYFKARDELVWGWRYCDDGGKLARLYVLFDGTRLTVRSTQSVLEDQASYVTDGGHDCAR